MRNKMPETPSPNPSNSRSTARSGSRIGSIDGASFGLTIGALISVVLIIYAIKTLLPASADPDPTAPQTTEQPNLGDPDPASTKTAPLQTIEEVLESVQAYVSAGEYQPARTILRSAIAQYPADTDLRFALGDLMLMTEDYQQAYDQYLAAIEQQSTNANGVDPKSLFTAGTLANMIDQPEMALVHYKAAMQADSSNPEYPLYLANIQFKLNKLEEAKASLAIAARLSPDRAMVYGTWAKIALRQNKLTIAQQQIEKARNLEPAIAAWTILEANIQKRMGNPERSIELLSSLPQSEINTPESMRLLAESFGMIGQPEDAASRMLDYANENPDDPQAAFDTAVWLERADQRQDAILWGRRARDLGHKRAQGWLDSLPKK